MNDKCVACGQVAEGKPLYKKLGSSDCQVDVFTALHQMQLVSLPAHSKSSYYICWDCDEAIADEYATYLENEEKKKALDEKHRLEVNAEVLKLRAKLRKVFKSGKNPNHSSPVVTKRVNKEKENELNEKKYFASHCLLCKSSFDSEKSQQRYTLRKMVDDVIDIGDLLEKDGILQKVTAEQKRQRYVCCQCFNKIRRNRKSKLGNTSCNWGGVVASPIPQTLFGDQQRVPNMNKAIRRPTAEEHAAEIAKLIPASIADLYKVVTNDTPTNKSKKTPSKLKGPIRNNLLSENQNGHSDLCESTTDSSYSDEDTDSSDHSIPNYGKIVVRKNIPVKAKEAPFVTPKRKESNDVKLAPKHSTLRILFPKGSGDTLSSPTTASSSEGDIVDFGMCNLCGCGHNSRPVGFWYNLKSEMPEVHGVTVLNALKILDTDLAKVSQADREKGLVCRPCYSRVSKGFKSQILQKVAEKKGMDVDALGSLKLSVKAFDKTPAKNNSPPSSSESKSKQKVSNIKVEKIEQMKAPNSASKFSKSKPIKSQSKSKENSKPVLPANTHSNKDLKKDSTKDNIPLANCNGIASSKKEKVIDFPSKHNKKNIKNSPAKNINSKEPHKNINETSMKDPLKYILKFKLRKESKKSVEYQQDLELLKLINKSQHLRYKGKIVQLHNVRVNLADIFTLINNDGNRNSRIRLELLDDAFRYTNHLRNIKCKSQSNLCILCKKVKMKISETCLWLEDPIDPPCLMVPMRWAQLSLGGPPPTTKADLALEDGKVCKTCHNNLLNEFSIFVMNQVATSHGLISDKVMLEKYKVSFDSNAMNIVADPLDKQSLSYFIKRSKYKDKLSNDNDKLISKSDMNKEMNGKLLDTIVSKNEKSENIENLEKLAESNSNKSDDFMKEGMSVKASSKTGGENVEKDWMSADSEAKLAEEFPIDEDNRSNESDPVKRCFLEVSDSSDAESEDDSLSKNKQDTFANKSDNEKEKIDDIKDSHSILQKEVPVDNSSSNTTKAPSADLVLLPKNTECTDTSESMNYKIVENGPKIIDDKDSSEESAPSDELAIKSIITEDNSKFPEESNNDNSAKREGGEDRGEAIDEMNAVEDISKEKLDDQQEVEEDEDEDLYKEKSIDQPKYFEEEKLDDIVDDDKLDELNKQSFDHLASNDIELDTTNKLNSEYSPKSKQICPEDTCGAKINNIKDDVVQKNDGDNMKDSDMNDISDGSKGENKTIDECNNQAVSEVIDEANSKDQDSLPVTPSKTRPKLKVHTTREIVDSSPQFDNEPSASLESVMDSNKKIESSENDFIKESHAKLSNLVENEHHNKKDAEECEEILDKKVSKVKDVLNLGENKDKSKLNEDKNSKRNDEKSETILKLCVDQNYTTGGNSENNVANGKLSKNVLRFSRTTTSKLLDLKLNEVETKDCKGKKEITSSKLESKIKEIHESCKRMGYDRSKRRERYRLILKGKSKLKGNVGNTDQNKILEEVPKDNDNQLGSKEINTKSKDISTPKSNSPKVKELKQKSKIHLGKPKEDICSDDTIKKGDCLDEQSYFKHRVKSIKRKLSPESSNDTSNKKSKSILGTSDKEVDEKTCKTEPNKRKFRTTTDSSSLSKKKLRSSRSSSRTSSPIGKSNSFRDEEIATIGENLKEIFKNQSPVQLSSTASQKNEKYRYIKELDCFTVIPTDEENSESDPCEENNDNSSDMSDGNNPSLNTNDGGSKQSMKNIDKISKNLKTGAESLKQSSVIYDTGVKIGAKKAGKLHRQIQPPEKLNELGDDFAENEDNDLEIEKEYPEDEPSLEKLLQNSSCHETSLDENSVAPFASRKKIRTKAPSVESEPKKPPQEDGIENVWQSIQGVNIDDLLMEETLQPLKPTQYTVGLIFALNDFRVHLGASFDDLSKWLYLLMPMILREIYVYPCTENVKSYLEDYTGPDKTVDLTKLNDLIPESLFKMQQIKQKFSAKSTSKKKRKKDCFVEDVLNYNYKEREERFTLHWDDFLSSVNLDQLFADDSDHPQVLWEDFNNGLLYALWRVKEYLFESDEMLIKWLAEVASNKMTPSDFKSMVNAAKLIHNHIGKYSIELKRLNAPIVVRSVSPQNKSRSPTIVEEKQTEIDDEIIILDDELSKPSTSSYIPSKASQRSSSATSTASPNDDFDSRESFDLGTNVESSEKQSNKFSKNETNKSSNLNSDSVNSLQDKITTNILKSRLDGVCSAKKTARVCPQPAAKQVNFGLHKKIGKTLPKKPPIIRVASNLFSNEKKSLTSNNNNENPETSPSVSKTVNVNKSISVSTANVNTVNNFNGPLHQTLVPGYPLTGSQPSINQTAPVNMQPNASSAMLIQQSAVNSNNSAIFHVIPYITPPAGMAMVPYNNVRLGTPQMSPMIMPGAISLGNRPPGLSNQLGPPMQPYINQNDDFQPIIANCQSIQNFGDGLSAKVMNLEKKLQLVHEQNTRLWEVNKKLMVEKLNDKKKVKKTPSKSEVDVRHIPITTNAIKKKAINIPIVKF